MRELNQLLGKSSIKNEKLKKIQFLLKLFEHLEEQSKKLGKEDPQIKKNLDTFYKLAEPYLQFDGNTSLKSIKIDTRVTRKLLGFESVPSIDYLFVNNQNVYMQLHLDNLRMEGLLSNPKKIRKRENDLDRFKEFCTSAFYQIEELINYYYSIKFNSFEKFLNYLETKNPRFKKSVKPTSIATISISEKIFLFEKEHYFNKGYYESNITKIRKIRNEDLHRCTIIEKDQNGLLEKYKNLIVKIKKYNSEQREKYKIENKKRKEEKRPITYYYQKSDVEKKIESEGKFIKFLQARDYNLVRQTIISIVEKIKQNI